MLRLPTRFIRRKWEGNANWSVDSNGIAFCTPELGPNLLVNGNFAVDANWTKGAGWTIAGGVGVGTAATSNITQPVGAVGQFVYMTWDLVSRSAGTVRARAGTSAGFNVSTPGSYAVTFFDNGDTDVGIVGTGFTGTVDNVAAYITPILVFDYAGRFVPRNDHVGVRIHNWTPSGANFNLAILSDGLTENSNQLRVQAFSSMTQQFQLSLLKRVNGVGTVLIAGTTVTFVPDALLEIRRTNDTTFQLWYNGVQIGTDQTVSDPEVLSGGWCGISSRLPQRTYSEFQVGGKVVPWNFK